jgi:hypothetical protein
MRRFVVEGVWLEGNIGSVTSDFVAAESTSAAIALVESARSKVEDWQLSAAMEFGEFVETQKAAVERMAAMSIADVAASWAETEASLGGGRR